MNDIQQLIVRSGLSLHEMFERMDKGRQGILLLVDESGRLLRTVTDGDLRRLLLKGVLLDDMNYELPAKPPVTAPVTSSGNQILALMRSEKVNQIPLLDESGKPVSIVQLHDLEEPILLSTPHMGDQEISFVNQAFDTNWIAPLGPNVDAFEKELAEMVGIEHAAALSSGTAALHLALILLGVERGDTVFCSSLTFVASANPILYQGATPVFIDSDPYTWNMSPRALERALLQADASGKHPKAVIVVNLYGQSADMDLIKSLCDRFDIPIIEDAAESLGATYKGKASGTLGTIGVYSFNGNKIITTSGGGMLVSDDGDLVKRARFLSTQARDNAPYYLHSQVGYNYRMSNVLAGIGRGQLKVLNDRVAARRAIFERYKEGLSDIPYIQWMPEADYGISTRWLSCFTIDPNNSPLTVDELITHLANNDIEARRVWRPMHLQPLFKGCEYFPYAENTSVSNILFENGLCLPSGSNMTKEQQARVIDAIIDGFKQ